MDRLARWALRGRRPGRTGGGRGGAGTARCGAAGHWMTPAGAPD